MHSAVFLELCTVQCSLRTVHSIVFLVNSRLVNSAQCSVPCGQCQPAVFPVPQPLGQGTVWQFFARGRRCSALLSAQCTVLCTVYCILYSVHCSLFTVNYSLCTVHCSLFTVNYSLCTVHCALCTVYCALCSVHCVLCTVQWDSVPASDSLPQRVEPLSINKVSHAYSL